MRYLMATLILAVGLAGCEQSTSDHIEDVEAILEECRGLREVKADFEALGTETADYYARLTAAKIRALGC